MQAHMHWCKYPYYCNPWKSDLCLHDTSNWELPHECDPEVYIWHCEWLCALVIQCSLYHVHKKGMPQEFHLTARLHPPGLSVPCYYVQL